MSGGDRNIRLLYAFWFLRDFQVWIPVWIVFLTVEQGFSLTEVTTAEGLYLVGVLCLEVPTGAVADRWGRSRSLALGAAFLGLAVLTFAFATTFPVLMVSFMIWSLAHALMSGADNALLFDTLKAAGNEAKFERFAGRGLALTWGGAGIATFLGGPLAGVIDTRATIYIGAATCLVAAFVALLLSEPAREAPEKGERYLTSIREAFREVWSNGEVRTVILLAGTAAAAIEAVGYLVQPYLLDRGVEVGATFSLLQVPTIIAGVVGSLGAAWILRRTGEAVPLRVVPVIGAAAYGALVIAPGLTAYAALPALYVLGATLVPISTGFVNRRVGSERRATILSIEGMVTGVTLAIMSPVVGFTTDNWGLPQAFAVGAFACLAAVALFGMPSRSRTAAASAPALDAEL